MACILALLSSFFFFLKCGFKSSFPNSFPFLIQYIYLLIHCVLDLIRPAKKEDKQDVGWDDEVARPWDHEIVLFRFYFGKCGGCQAS